MGDLRIALYVSSVKGHHVTRFGTGTLIGATIDLEHPGNVRWDEAKVVAIPEAEYSAYKREYDGLIADGALKKRTAEDFAAYQRALEAELDNAAKPAAAKRPATTTEKA